MPSALTSSDHHGAKDGPSHRRLDMRPKLKFFWVVLSQGKVLGTYSDRIDAVCESMPGMAIRRVALWVL